MSEEPLRPDPDALLAAARAADARAERGRLKIYFGASAGVGKTWAMLDDAQRLRAGNVDLVVGVAETHGRSETAALLQGLECLPPRTVTLHGRSLPEFDLDAALARRPALLLVDELAHSNAPGSRHPKRWQDIEELLDAFTRFNYPAEIGPGVYDIHSPRVPDSAEMANLLRKAARRIPLQRLWVNPDCGLKTRAWPETEAALVNMVAAARQLRAELA